MEGERDWYVHLLYPPVAAFLSDSTFRQQKYVDCGLNWYSALKQGHATRPLAVVQKKNLSGIGKDRDEAVPFWDQYVHSSLSLIVSLLGLTVEGV
jgi:hypothetical protein